MITKRIQATTRLFMATISLAAVALATVAAPAAGAAGLRNCIDVSGPQSGRAQRPDEDRVVAGLEVRQARQHRLPRRLAMPGVDGQLGSDHLDERPDIGIDLAGRQRGPLGDPVGGRGLVPVRTE